MQNFILNKIGFMNFQSFGNQMTWIDLDAAPLTAIKAINMDVGDSGESSNGGGKSTCFNAISYALYGEGVDKAKADEFINLVNGKRLLVELHFTTGKSTGIIRRGRKPNILELEIDGVSLTRDSMRNTDAAITELIGMSYDVFMLTCYMSPNRRTFFEMDGPTQRSVMEQMLSLDVLAARADAVRKMASEAKVDLKVLDREVEILQRSLDKAVQAHSADAESFENFEEKRKVDIRKLETVIEKYKDVDFDAICDAFSKSRDDRARKREIENELKAIESKVEVLTGDLERLEELRADAEKYDNLMCGYQSEVQSKIADLKKKRSSYDEAAIVESIEFKKSTAEIDSIELEIKTIERQKDHALRKLDEVLEHLVQMDDGKCPVCNSDYVDSEKVSQLRSKEAELREELELLESSLSDLKDRRSGVTLTGKDHFPDETVGGCERMLRDVESIEQEIQREESSIGDNKYLPLYESTMREVEKLEAKDIEGELRGLIDPVDALEDELKRLEDAEYDFGGFESEREAVNAENDYDYAIRELKSVREAVNPYAQILEVREQTIAETEASLSEAKAKVDEIKHLEEHYGFLVKLLTDSKSFVRRRILDNYVPYINKRIVEYSTQMGLTHVCELKSDLSMEILYMNRPVSFSLMSRGEKLRLNIATTMAFRDAISLLGKGCNIALVDEFLDSALDGYGIRVGTKLITECAANVFLITHREDLADISPRKLTVVKQNGFSSLQ